MNKPTMKHRESRVRARRTRAKSEKGVAAVAAALNRLAASQEAQTTLQVEMFKRFDALLERAVAAGMLPPEPTPPVLEGEHDH